MKLYLASQGFLTKTQFRYLTGKGFKEARVALIMNAVDWRTPYGRKIRYAATGQLFKKLGIKVDLLDLRKFYGKSYSDLAKKLKQYDLIWVRGGNVFFLRYVMQKSGFDKAIKDALKHGVVYAAESAGVLVVGPTLKYIQDADDPSAAPKVIWAGIRLIDIVPLPHWGSIEYGGSLRKAFFSLRKDGFRALKLSDGEALLVEGRRRKKVKANLFWRK